MNIVSVPGSVVVGVDGSQAALHAVRWAAVEARRAWCPVSLVHTLEWPVVSFPVAGLPVDWTQEILWGSKSRSPPLSRGFTPLARTR